MWRPATLLLGLAVLVACWPAQARGSGPGAIALQVEAGFAGFVRSAHTAPVRVDLTNTGGDATLTLVAAEDDTAASRAPQPVQAFATRYQSTIELAHNAHKRVTLHLPLRGTGGRLRVRALLRGEVVGESDVAVRVLGPRQVLVGVVSDTVGSTGGLAQVTLPTLSGGTGAIFVANVAPGEVPTLADEITAFDALLLSHVASSAFSGEQMMALQGWVARGGVLLLPGGPDWEVRTAHLPADLLPVHGATVRGDVDLAPLGRFSGSTIPPAGGATVIAATPRGQTLVAADGLPLLSLLPYGTGSVVFLAADPDAEPLRAWPGVRDLWQQVLLRALPPQTLLNPSSPAQTSFDPSMNMANVLSNVPVLAPPSWSLLAGLLVVYVLLAGPLSYLLLRRLRRLGLNWVLQPSLALGFAALTYGIAFREKGSEAIVNTITVTEVPPGAPVVRQIAFVGLFAPTERDYHIEFPAGTLLSGLPAPFNKRFPGAPEPDGTVGLAVREDQHAVDLPHMGQWTQRGVRGERWVTPGETIVATVALGPDDVSGTVTNRGDDLRDCAVVTQWGVQRLDALPHGASASFRLLRERAAALPAVPLLYAVPPGTSAARTRAVQTEQQVVANLWPSINGYGMSDPAVGPLVFLGWGTPALPSPLVDGRPVRQGGLGLLVAGLSLDDARATVVPPGLLPTHLWSGSPGVTGQGTTVVVSSGPLIVTAALPVEASAVRSVTLSLLTPGSGTASALTISAFNHDTAAYDALPASQVRTFSPGVPTPIPMGRVTSVASASASAGAAGARPAAPAGTAVPLPAIVSMPPKSAFTEIDATLAPGAFGPYIYPDGTIRFRIASRGAVPVFAPPTYGYVLAEAPR